LSSIEKVVARVCRRYYLGDAEVEDFAFEMKLTSSKATTRHCAAVTEETSCYSETD
jgi:hypothetical protein